MASRYVDVCKGENRLVKKEGKTQEVFVANDNYGKPRWGTPLLRLEETARDANSAWCEALAGDIADVIGECPDDKASKALRDLVADKEATAKVKVRVEDLKTILKNLTVAA